MDNKTGIFGQLGRAIPPFNSKESWDFMFGRAAGRFSDDPRDWDRALTRDLEKKAIVECESLETYVRNVFKTMDDVLSNNTYEKQKDIADKYTDDIFHKMMKLFLEDNRAVHDYCMRHNIQLGNDRHIRTSIEQTLLMCFNIIYFYDETLKKIQHCEF